MNISDTFEQNVIKLNKCLGQHCAKKCETSVFTYTIRYINAHLFFNLTDPVPLTVSEIAMLFIFILGNLSDSIFLTMKRPI